MMFVSLLRFWLKGWIYDLYVAPKHFFTYYGFDWVKPFGEMGMYFLFFGVMLAAIGIALGLFYRWSATLFFLGFTYIELIDKSNYLNHYYFISIVSLLMILLPAHRHFSIDVWRKPSLNRNTTAAWTIGAIRLQLGTVYFFAGIAKLNYDWLFRAMPLKLWLPAHGTIPVVGALLQKTWVAFAFSWFGAIYDLFIPFFLMAKRFRWLAYGAVVSFHVITGWLFQIGMFPYIMILATLVFFSADFHERLLGKLKEWVRYPEIDGNSLSRGIQARWITAVLVLHFFIQWAFPFRYLAYPGDLFWHEQGFRFGWRVMLIEKAGSTFFYAQLPGSDRRIEIRNSDYLTPNQEKMMSTQPDMMLQFAQIIKKDLDEKGYPDAAIFAESYVTLNGSGSRPFIDSNVNLAELSDTWTNKQWIKPFEQ
ncbi:HTTM domain-containing protein [bacterium SCSIO 12741]|nr:HTTM domain-containing protein [bacterium SCSIO 12741]